MRGVAGARSETAVITCPPESPPASVRHERLASLFAKMLSAEHEDGSHCETASLIKCTLRTSWDPIRAVSSQHPGPGYTT